MRLVFYPDGTLHLEGRDGPWEANCSECGEPIRWVLDMFSFTTGPTYRLAHARCVWTPGAFVAQAELAPEHA